MNPRDRVEDATLEGVLIPVRWGSGGEVSEVSIMTFDEAEYRIDAAEAEAHHLRDHLRKRVRIRGRTRGGRLIEVSSIEVLDLHAPTPARQGKRE